MFVPFFFWGGGEPASLGFLECVVFGGWSQVGCTRFVSPRQVRLFALVFVFTFGLAKRLS